MSSNTEIVGTFENEFKNKGNVDIVYDLMAEDFVHHAPIPGVAPGREGLKEVGQFIFSQIDGIQVEVVHLFGEGDLVCDRIQANGRRKANGEAVSWTENHIYQVEDGKIVAWWGEGGPPLSPA
jgi:predicted SnoaL-like aldol condensation-catalyzing enzyme